MNDDGRKTFLKHLRIHTSDKLIFKNLIHLADNAPKYTSILYDMLLYEKRRTVIVRLLPSLHFFMLLNRMSFTSDKECTGHG